MNTAAEKTLTWADQKNLRIGNLLFLPEVKATVEVTALRKASSMVVINRMGDPDLFNFECSLPQLQPVMLSFEAFKHFGFKVNTYLEICTHERIVTVDNKPEVAIFEVNKSGSGWWFRRVYGFATHYKPMHYVHELQNLFHALTGEELKLQK